MAILTFVLLYITFSSLESYTNHGEEFSLPDFSGMTIGQVADVAKQKNLRFEITDSIFSRRKKRGSVLEQDPPPGFKVKKGRRVFLVMNATQPEIIRMPRAKGVDFKQAWMDLESKGLSVERITYQPDPNRHYVLQQKYQGNIINIDEDIEKGAGIELVLGSGSDVNRTSVPSVLTMTLRNARRKLLGSYLNVGAVNYDRSVLTYEDSMRAFIWKHRPNVMPFDVMPAGSEVNLWLTVDSARIESDSTRIKKMDTTLLYQVNEAELQLKDSTLIQTDSLQ